MPDMLVEHLLSVGYTRVDVVEMPGQVTLRGGILDVYSPEMDRPVRFEFFGDEIETIRKFDPETQRSRVRRWIPRCCCRSRKLRVNGQGC